MATNRISIDIDENEHKYLKMCCVKMGVSIKQFVLDAIINKVDEQEDQWWLEKKETKDLLEKSEKGLLETVSFEDVLKELALNV